MKGGTLAAWEERCVPGDWLANATTNPPMEGTGKSSIPSRESLGLAAM